MMERQSLATFWENWEFFQDAVFSGVLAAILLGVLGFYILAKRLVFLSASLSQVSSAGIALGVWLSMLSSTELVSLHEGVHSHSNGVSKGFFTFIIDPIIVAGILALSLAVFISYAQQRSGRDLTALVAMIYLAGASVTLMIGTRIVTEIQDIQQLLVGNAVLVSEEDFRLLFILTISVLALHFYARRGFEITTLDADGAKVGGLSVSFLQFILMSSLVVSIVVATKVLGALPVFAFSVLPAMAARQLSYNMASMLVLSALIGALSAFLGYLLAFLYAFPVGPSQAFVALMAVILAYAMRFLWLGMLKLRAMRNQEKLNSLSVAES